MNKSGTLILSLLTLLYLSNWFIWQPRTPKQQPQQTCISILKVVRCDTNEQGQFVFTTKDAQEQVFYITDTVVCKQYYIVRL